MPAPHANLILTGIVRVLGPVGWAVIAVCVAANLFVGDDSSETAQLVLVASLAVFFAILLVRLVCAAIVAASRRRGALLVLIGSIALWAAGASYVNTDKLSDPTQFPAPGEWLFLASYIGLAAYLVVDERRRMSRALATWLDVVMVCGGTGCLAATALLMPVATAYGTSGLPLLLALLYPLIDVVLALVVIAQVVLRLRPDLKGAVLTCAGFILLAYADGHFVASQASSSYSFSAFSDVVWGAGFALIVGSACRSGIGGLVAVPRRPGSVALIFAAAAALIVLTLRPSDGLGPYIAAPAVLTLMAAGGRLVLALGEAKRAAEALALSETDELTMLPNRRSVRIRLDQGPAEGQPMALMLLDMDGFKEINDTLGHAAGDTVLQLSAYRIRDLLPPEAMVARLGGDEFAVVVANDDEIDLLESARRVLDTLSEPLTVDGIEIAPRASIGIAVRTETDEDGTDLMRRADVAMYQAKLTRSGVALYDAHRDDFSRPRLQLAEELRKGIADGQLVLWYQPQIDAQTRKVCGLEALVRWQHPKRGLLSPAEFLPAARRAGLMSMLTDETARQAVADTKRLRAEGLEQRVAINCAPPELLSGVFLTRLYKTLAEADVPATAFVVEVTEDSFLADPERAREVLFEMREHDLQIAIDDYGTGFSSLSYLRDLPVQELKIDRSFVATMMADPRGRTIVLSTVQMAHGLGLRTVAEGVEDAATAIELIAMGVDVLQGYHMARPMPRDNVAAWIGDWSTFADSVGSWPLSPAEDDEWQPHAPARTTRVRSARRPPGVDVPARPARSP
jgi:diguanylate cyclase